ncbi:MAG TPA: Wzz/FepE/Etk N-terminal domain-containing protein [Terriglobales bacterium]|nr:Wzz/FepE/Etk N-terminal domain-containing protein [Terriglobales bacterium]
MGPIIMSEELEQNSSGNWEKYWDIVKRRRWWIILPGVLFWAAAVTASWLIPPKYRSETVILVEQPSVPAQYVTPNVTVNLQTRLRSLSEQILSRTRLLRIVQDMHLYPKFGQDLDRVVEQMRKDILIELVGSQERNEVTGFKISYSASDPHLAQEVAGRLTSLFINENLRSQQELSEGTTEFLQSELESARKNLEKQEAELRDFRTRFLGELPEQAQGNMQILSGLQARRDGASQALNHAEQQKLYLSSLIEQYRAPRTALDPTGKAKSTNEQQIESLQSQLAEARARYTGRHPDVLRLQEQIANAQQLKRAMDQQAKTAPPEREKLDDASTETPVLQLQGQLRATELEIANRKKQIQEVERQIDDYQTRLNMAPVREQQFASLTRNYNQSRTNYESLLAKKMQSQMAANLEKRQQGEQFRVLDPPSFPRKPYFPKRLYLVLGGLAAGIATGLAFVIGLELLYARIHQEQDILELGHSVFGTVPPLPTEDELQSTRRLRRLEFTTAAFIAALIPAVTAITYLKG